jgi:hypothetical protein
MACPNFVPAPDRASIPGWRPLSEEERDDFCVFELNRTSKRTKHSRGFVDPEKAGASFMPDYQNTQTIDLALYKTFVAEGLIKEE